MIETLPGLNEFLAMSAATRELVLESIARALGHPWYAERTILVFDDTRRASIPDDEGPEGPAFVFVPGGSFRPGLSPGELATLQAWLDEARRAEAWHRSRRNTAKGPDVEIVTEQVELELSPEEQDLAQLIDQSFGHPPQRSTRLVTDRVEVRHIPRPIETCPFHAVDDVDVLSESIAELEAGNPWGPPISIDPFLIARLPFALGKRHRALGLRPPTDREFEWALRAGTETLFWHGDEPPSDIGFDRLEPHEDPSRHPLGLLALGWFEEACVGELRPEDGIRTFRGGAADMSPWQGSEFFVLASAYRSLTAYQDPVTRAVLPLRR